MDMGQYLEVFIEESKDHLQNLNQNLLYLEKNPEDMTTLNEIFRVSHTLKGIAGTMGFTKMSELTHAMENVLQTIRNGQVSVTSDLVDLLFKCFDALEGYLNEIINTSSEGDEQYDDIISQLRDISKNKGKSQDSKQKQSKQTKKEETKKKETKKEETKKEETKKSKETEATDKDESEQENIGSVLLDGTVIDDPKDSEETQSSESTQEKQYSEDEENKTAYKIDVRLNSGCLLKSARAFIVFQMLEKYAQVIDSNPSIADIEEENFEFQFSVLVTTNQSKDRIIKDLSKIAEVDEVEVTENGELEKQQTETEEIKEEEQEQEEQQQEQEEQEEQQQEQEQEEQQQQEQEQQEPKSNTTQTKKVEQQQDKNKQAETSQIKKRITSKTVRVDIGRLDNLMNLVSELIIIKTSLEDISSNEKSSEKTNDYKEGIEYLERITTNLHDAVVKVRMVPVENVFNRFPRMIRDLSKELGKEIVLNMSGEETEVDRTVIDELGDPLIHLLRNSADHGIEDPAKRKELGKPTHGTINLRAYHDGNNVVIEVEDDGKGIDVEKIKEKIVEKGLAGSEEVKNLDDHDSIQYLFRPSFSTSAKVTDVSGRGVGLDVVKTKIEALGGEIEVESKLHKGCKFVIRLPLTLAIIQALLVNIAQESYAIPLSSIKEIINISPDEIKSVQNQEVYMLRDEVIPVVRLDKELEVPKEDDEQKDELTIVIVKRGEKLSGFLVDDLLGQQEIVIKSLGKYLRGIKSIAGATILGDGQVALILDVNSLA